MTYSVAIAYVKYTETRRGITAEAPIHKDGKPFAVLWDTPEEIVASVDFVDPAMRDMFLQDAKIAGFGMDSDAYSISEYARSILEKAEQDYRDAHKVKT